MTKVQTDGTSSTVCSFVIFAKVNVNLLNFRRVKIDLVVVGAKI
ncbi:hypothetical protein [Paenibacillus monticola]|nr:hypothetical protein [Paenibacillus monticola]